MTNAERIHHLFNELRAKMCEAAQDAHLDDDQDLQCDLDELASRIDAAHHDYTELTLRKVLD